MAKTKKIVPYRKPKNFNIGTLIFTLIFLYLALCVFKYLGRDKIQFYEVVEGSIVNDKTYTGLILREETVKQAEQSGYVNYYVREGKKAAAGSRIYSLDETGELEHYLEESQEAGQAFTDENLALLKKKLASLCLSYDDSEFSSVYDEKYSLDASVVELVNFNALDQLDSELETKGIHFQQIYTDQAGIISYAIDSYEGMEPSAVTADSFKKENYKKSVGQAGKLIEAGTPVYKMITSENWSILFPLTEEDKAAYADKDRLQIKFIDDNLTLSGAYSQITGADGGSYGKLDFDRFMVQFISDRFAEFEVVSEAEEGLKIPAASVTTKDFFTIPVEFAASGGDESSARTGFYKEVYSESGEASVVFTPAEIYGSTDEYYYVETSEDGAFKNGDYIVKQDSSERYQIGATAPLEGVYNINKGYAVFKKIEKLSGNGEYFTIAKGTDYGLSVYDHIVLDASMVTEGMIIYE